MIDHQTGQVLDDQHQGLDQLDSFPALDGWRDLMVGILTKVQCAGGCPLGSLASELSGTDPVARVQLANAFALWEELIRQGLRRMQDPKPLEMAVNTMIAHLRGLAS